MRISKIVGFVLLGWIGGVSAASAQTRPSDIARQHLESGLQFYTQERYDQALNAFSNHRHFDA